ncbi:hypothetical protein HN031_01045 [Nocardioides sp. zg-1308]|uniref:rhamnosyltransferase WsaF family glycosyltransferase n=1 Tax=Nocardioides sp. zg-1308 TaxID=2736253 RepID=UPI001555C8EF|nr:hypothetical protein [Nocardioides sp. zg-1308]NPD03277.1 hypothetical protein [Nocardioides sp. zg-1308]
MSDQPKSDADLLRESELFDVEFYLRKNPDVRTSGIDPVLHYLRQGARDGRDPSKAFSTNAYLRRNDDVGQMNPLVHYLRVGKPAGRALNPLEDDLRLVRESGFFDEDYYRHFKPDLPAERDAVRHYLRFGRRDGLDPSEKFSTSGYLRQNPDVARTTWNPLVHYLRHGRTEGRIAPRGALREPYFDALYADRWAQIAPMPVTKVAGGSHRITIVTDSVAPHSLFGGVGTAIILGVEIANRLGASLRLVTRTDAPDGQVISLLQEATGIRLEGVLELDQVSTDGTQRLQFTDRDIVMTTSWWTTRSVLDSDVPREQVLYLLQEDERMFYAFGDERLLCSETLAEPDLAVVVNTSRLLSHLVADGLPHLREQAVALEPAFPGEVATTPAGSGDGRRNFFFYSRPHNARNLFWRGGQVIARAVESRLLDPDEWRFHFVGRGTPDLTLPRDVQVEVVEGLSWTDYQAFVRTMDAALVLMDTPHPSYPPYDLASVGAAVLTNSHGIKTDLSDISDNIIVAPSTVDGLLAGLERLVALARDPQQRAANVAADHIGRDWAAATAPVVDWVVDRFGAVVGPRQDDGLHVL